MNLTIKTKALNEALHSVSKAVFENSPQAELRGILINAESDKLTLIGSDANVSVQSIVEKTDDNGLLIAEEGTILLNAKYVLDMVRKVGSEDITFDSDERNLVRIKGGHAEFKVNGMKPGDYPKLKFERPEDCIALQNSVMKAMLDKISHAASVKESNRPILTGINFSFDGEKLSAVATDSYRLAKTYIPFTSEGNFNITIPAKSMKAVSDILLSDENGMVNFAQDNKQATFWNETTVVKVRLLDGNYPTVDHLIPSSFDKTFVVNRESLIDALDRTAFIKNDNISVVKLTLSETESCLSSRSQEIGESKEPLTGTFTGEAMSISFSEKMAIEALRALSGTDVRMSFNGDMKAFIIMSMEDNSCLQLLLPIRTYD